MKRILLSIAILFLCVSTADAWTFGNIRVNGESLLLGPVIARSYYNQRYNGTFRDAFSVDYTGSGNNIFDWRADGTSVFALAKDGTLVLVGTLSATSLGLNDTDASNVLSLVWNENDSSDRTLNFLVGGGSRSLTLNENFTIGDGFDFSLTAEDAAGSILLDNITVEFENGFGTQRLLKIIQGTDAAATLTVEGGSAAVNQDTTTDGSPAFAALTLGNNDDNDPSITFDGDTSDGVLNWDEDNSHFEFDNTVKAAGDFIAGEAGTSGRGEVGTGDTDIQVNDVIGRYDFRSDDVSTGAAGIKGSVRLTNDASANWDGNVTSHDGRMKFYVPVDSVETLALTLDESLGATVAGALAAAGDLTLNAADPAIIFDGSTASDTDFWMGITADEVGDDNDLLQIGKGITKGTTPFFTWNKDGGFIAQNLTDTITGYQFLDSNGGVPTLSIDTTNERVGIGTAGPDRKLDVLDASDPQLRLTHTDGTVYTDFQTDANGDLTISPTGLDILVPQFTELGFNDTHDIQFNSNNVKIAGTFQFASGGELTMGGGITMFLDTANRPIVIGEQTTTITDLLIDMAIDTYFRTNASIGSTRTPEKLSVFDGNMEVYDSNDLGSESLDEVDFTTHASWDDVGDFDSEGGAAVYTHSGGTGTLTQQSGNMVLAGVGNRWYKFTYTVSSVTETGTLAATITTAFAASAVTLDVNTEQTDTVYFQSTASPGNFIISATSDTGGDTFTIDDVTLKEIQGGDVIVNGLITGGGTDGIKVLANGDIGLGNANPDELAHIGSGTKHDGYRITETAEVQTIGAGQTTLESITLLDENTYHVEAFVVGVQSDGTDRASYHIAATVYRTGAGNATIQGTVTSIHTQESNGALDATFTVNGSDVRCSVTGIAAETWEWGTTLKYINMSN